MSTNPTRDEQLAAAMPDYRAVLVRLARSFCPNPYVDVDDLAQEGHIAMWRAVDRHQEARGNLAGFLYVTARQRMLTVATGGRTEGSASGRAETYAKKGGEATRSRIREFIDQWRKTHDGAEPRKVDIASGLGMDSGNVHRHLQRMDLRPTPAAPPRVDSLDALLDEYGPLGFLAAPEVLDDVALAYHHGEIHLAIAELPETWRAYVVGRFWYGLSDTEIRARTGFRPRPDRWERVRAGLAERLGHLIDAR